MSRHYCSTCIVGVDLIRRGCASKTAACQSNDNALQHNIDARRGRLLGARARSQIFEQLLDTSTLDDHAPAFRGVPKQYVEQSKGEGRCVGIYRSNNVEIISNDHGRQPHDALERGVQKF